MWQWRKVAQISHHSVSLDRFLSGSPNRGLDQQVVRIFDKKPLISRGIDEFLERRLGEMNISNIINFLQLASKRRHSVEEKTLGQICDRIQRFQSRMQDHHLGKAFHGLRAHNSSPNALRLVSVYTDCLQRFDQLSPLTLANACSALQWFPADSEEHRRLLAHLTRILNSHPSLLVSNSNVSSILAGLRGLQDTPVSRTLLRSLIDISRTATGELAAYQAADMLLGVSSMAISGPDFRDLLDLVSKKLFEVRPPLDNRQLDRCLVALRKIHRSFRSSPLSLCLPPPPHSSSSHLPSCDLSLDSCRGYSQPPSVYLHLLSQLSEPMDAHNFSTVMSVFQNFTSSQAEAHSLLRILAQELHRNRKKFDPRSIISGVAGLRFMTCGPDSPGTEAFLSALHSKLLQDGQQRSRFSPRDLSSMLYGLQTMTAETDSVRLWLGFLTSQLTAAAAGHGSSSRFDLTTLTRLLTGVRLMRSEYPEVREIFGIVALQLPSLSALDKTSFVQMAFSLQGKSSDHPEILSFLSAFTSKLRESSFESVSDSNDLCKVVSGFGELNSHLSETRDLLSAVVEKCSQLPSIARVDVHNVATAAYALRSLDSRYAEVNSLLELLSMHLSLTTHDGMRYGNLSNVDFLNALLGLRRLNSDSPAVQKWLCVLIDPLIASGSPSAINVNQLCGATASLSHLANEHEAVRRLVVLLTERLQDSVGTLNPWAFSEAVFGMRRLYEFEDSEGITSTLLTTLLSRIEGSSEEFSEKNLVRLCAQLCWLQTPRCEPFQALVNLAAQKLQSSPAKLSPRSLSILIGGMRGLSSARSSTRNLIGALVPRVSSQNDLFSRDEFCVAIGGLERMNSTHDCVRKLFETLLEKAPLNLWDNISPTQASLLAAGMSSLNPFEFDAVNQILLPLSQQRWKLAEVSAEAGWRDGDSAERLARQSALLAIDRMMSRTGIDQLGEEQRGLGAQKRMLRDIQKLLLRAEFVRKR